ncbi:MAG TPA: helix-turn-helix domain-containing protein [Rhodanobacteraceae bacterium]|nr:helix-turn-helix domain-containing protein [Rhodanobacteraceae bacterium]
METTALQQLGFTDYEARAYVALLAGGELNGYALSKATGIPRANIYAVAGKLVQRGAARRIENSAGTAYVAADSGQLLRDIESHQRQALGAARQALAQLRPQSTPPHMVNLRGDEVLAHARRLIDRCSQTLLIAVQPTEAALLATQVRQTRERGVAITTLCLEGCENDCGGCAGQIHRCNLAPGGRARWLLLVGDGSSALMAQMADGATAVLTEHPLVVELASAYIQQSATLATLGSELAGRFDGLLSAETLRLLDGLYPDSSFLAHMRTATPPTT